MIGQVQFKKKIFYIFLWDLTSFCLVVAFMSVLHLYETFGWWRRADYLKVHFAESWNEMHHLLIMEVRYFFSFDLIF